MKISVKDMIVSFAIATVIFGFVMVAVCTGIFDRTVDPAYAVKEVENGVRLHDENNEQCVLFLCRPNGKTETPAFALMARFDAEKCRAVFTKIDFSYLVTYKETPKTVGSIFLEGGNDLLLSLAESVTGVAPAKVCELFDFVNGSTDEMYGSNDMISIFADQLFAFAENNPEGVDFIPVPKGGLSAYKVYEFCLAMNGNNVDIEATLSEFHKDRYGF